MDIKVLRLTETSAVRKLNEMKKCNVVCYASRKCYYSKAKFS